LEKRKKKRAENLLSRSTRANFLLAKQTRKERRRKIKLKVAGELKPSTAKWRREKRSHHEERTWMPTR